MNIYIINNYRPIGITTVLNTITIFQIFSFLSLDDRVLDACLVCKMWYGICFDGIFWKHIDFEDRRRVCLPSVEIAIA